MGTALLRAAAAATGVPPENGTLLYLILGTAGACFAGTASLAGLLLRKALEWRRRRGYESVRRGGRRRAPDPYVASLLGASCDDLEF